MHRVRPAVAASIRRAVQPSRTLFSSSKDATATTARPKKRFSRTLKVTAAATALAGTLGVLVVYKNNPRPQRDPDPTKKTLLVLGSGWGATSFLKRLDTSEYNTIVVSPRNYFLYTPLLPSVTTGSIESRSIITPVKYFLRFKPVGVTFVEAEATDIDPQSKTVEVVDNSEITGVVTKTRVPYDYLVICVGSESQTFGIKGVREHGLFLKETWDAKRIRTRLMDCTETAAFPGQPEDEIKRLLHMVVVGGGPTGVEYAGELHDFLVDEISKWYPAVAKDVRITLIEALPHVLASFSAKMIDYTEQSFKDMQIDVLNNTSVKEVRQKELVVQEKSGEMKTIPYGMLVWATGNVARPLVKDFLNKLPADKQPNKRGISVDDYLRVTGSEDIYAMGDCTATRYAPTAQVASQQGKFLARVFNDLAAAERTGKDIVHSNSPFTYKHRATLAYIGGDRGVGDLPLPNWVKRLMKDDEDIGGKSAPVSAHHGLLSLSGYQGYLFWRSAYLSNLYTLRNRTLVAFDWTKGALFGRDISRE
ncbi:NADH:ubiquinone oxidoreductase [Sorochytrium milnesiophthora]